MTHCNITGCDHSVVFRGRRTTGWYWKKHNICNCCAGELWEMGVIGKDKKIFKPWKLSWVCRQSLTKEIEANFRLVIP